jgi:hypothetical protein
MRVAKKRISISLHPIELAKLDRIGDEYGETRSGMLIRLIQEFPEAEHKDTCTLADATELRFKLREKKAERKKSPKEYEEIDEIGELTGSGQ